MGSLKGKQAKTIWAHLLSLCVVLRCTVFIHNFIFLYASIFAKSDTKISNAFDLK